MQIFGVGKKPITFTLLASGLALVVGCGGTTVFSGQNPVVIAGEGPPPPPPPPVEAPKPPEPPPKVVVKDNKIEITEKIQFEYNKATILPASFGLLDEIAATIKKAPHLKKIAIEGHASSEGSADHNLKLSDERAKAVMKHLVDKGGLQATMFTAKGFGSQKMLQDDKKGTDKDAAEKNRRVEFNIVEQDVTKKKVQVDATGKETVVEEKTHSVKNESADPAPSKDKDKDKKDKDKDKDKDKKEKKDEKKEKKDEKKEKKDEKKEDKK